MTASGQTVAQLYDVIRRHVAADKIAALLADLAAVEGNRSFRETIERLRSRHARLSGQPDGRRDLPPCG